MLRAAFVGLFLILYILLVAPWFVLYAMLTGRVATLYRVGVGGARAAVRLAGIRVEVEGREHIPAGVCIFVANHTSNVDPPAVVASIPRRVALLAKQQVFRVPIMSRALRVAGFVPVIREDREAARASVDQALEQLRRGLSFLVFPEGTRSPDGRLRPFKKGSFLMALRAAVPIVPVAVAGSQRIMPKGSARICPGTVRVLFLPPVETAGYSVEQRDALIAAVHAAIAAALPADQQPDKSGTTDEHR